MDEAGALQGRRLHQDATLHTGIACLHGMHGTQSASYAMEPGLWAPQRAASLRS